MYRASRDGLLDRDEGTDMEEFPVVTCALFDKSLEEICDCMNTTMDLHKTICHKTMCQKTIGYTLPFLSQQCL